jgi:hypothetical protein
MSRPRPDVHPLRQYSVALALVAMGLIAIGLAPLAAPMHQPLQVGGVVVLCVGILALFLS